MPPKTGRRESPIVAEVEDLADLAQGLRSLRHQRGLTLEELSRRAHYSISALSAATSGRQLPTWELTRAFVQACDGDVAAWTPRWNSAARAVLKTGAVLETGRVQHVAYHSTVEGDIVQIREIAKGLPIPVPAQKDADAGLPDIPAVPPDESPPRGRLVIHTVAAVLMAGLGALLAWLNVPHGADALAGYGTPTSVVWTIPETAADANVSLFSDNHGTPTSLKIPSGTTVQVVCVAQNRSGIASINAFYLLGGPAQWRGLYAPANAFENSGDSWNGSRLVVDPRVPTCADGKAQATPH